MAKGPQFNYVDIRFTTRDSLGIESETASMQAELCPVVNTVTPRAFYWPFMVWNYWQYDIKTSQSNEIRNKECFDKDFLKKNDYFFVLATLLTTSAGEQKNLVGKDKSQKNLDDDPIGPYKYDEKYFQSTFGGMQYYNAGCFTLGFITDRDNTGVIYKFPVITRDYGHPLAEAFDDVIKNTNYYKKYKSVDNCEVSKEELIEYGNFIKFNLDGFDKCKKLLRDRLFGQPESTFLYKSNLIESANYLKIIHDKYGLVLDTKVMREILFDDFSPTGKYGNICDQNSKLGKIIKDWEVVIGRGYFTIAIEIIWQYILDFLGKTISMTKEEWIKESLNNAQFKDINLENNVCSIINKFNFGFDERESLITTGNKKLNNNIENAIKLLISLYNRFKDRTDINDYLIKRGSISLMDLINLVDNYKIKTIRDFVVYIIDNWIIKKHIEVATRKLYEGRDGFFFEVIDNNYYQKSTTTPDFQRLRMVALMQVMEDLDMFRI